MITKRKLFMFAVLPAMLLAIVPEARPVRVGMFRGIGTDGGFWHTNIHTASAVMAQILANPAAAGLGDSLVIPKDGFVFYAMPVAFATGSLTTECAGNGCGPTPDQLAAIVRSLDTLDVLIVNSASSVGGRIADSAQRRAFEAFWSKKGFVSVHATTDSKGYWPALDSAHGTRFRGHPAEQDGRIRPDPAHAAEPDWRFLNKGLFSNGTDTAFFEEWHYFTESGAAIRARANLKPTVNLDESTLANPGSQAAMGDHPMSWYRKLPTGGRIFHTGIGHRSQVWSTARTFRRQVYNAVLWAARVDSTGAVSLRNETAGSPVPQGITIRAEKGFVHFESGLPARVSVHAPDGRLMERRRGAAMRFALPAGGIYLLQVKAQDGTTVSRRVVVP